MTGGLALAAVCVVMAPATAPADPYIANPPAEETRLDQTTFREGLKKRGLTEVLALHLQDFPPSGKLDSLLMQRDVHLAMFRDSTKPAEERHAAVVEANGILKTVIERFADDPRAFQWRFDLARSLLYDEAESLISSVLYRGLNTGDREALLGLTGRAVKVLTELLEELSAEDERIENLPIPQFEQMERSGHVEHIDQLGPRAEYLLLWARLYDVLARPDADRTRARRLSRIEDYLEGHPEVVNTPHDTSRIQVQALVLAGVTHRLLNRHTEARQHLDQAVAVAERIRDGDEQARVQWAVTLATIESIRNDRDQGRYRSALQALERFVQSLANKGDEAFGLKLVAALIERSILRAQGDALSNPAEAKKARGRAWRPLARLARTHPDRRDEIYATLYGTMDPNAPPDAMDAYEKAAAIAGLLVQLGDHPAPDDPRMARIDALADSFLGEDPAQTGPLLPEVVFNLGVAAYRSGRHELAIQRFQRVARNHIPWEKSLQSAVYAVQLSSAMYEKDKQNAAAQAAFRASLDTLLTYYPQSDGAAYWRFFDAQLLDEMGEFDAAASQYALVHERHEHFIDAAFSRVRCLGQAMASAASEKSNDFLALRSRADDFFTAYRTFLSLATAMLAIPEGSGDRAETAKLVSRAKVVAAEVLVLPSVDRANQALESLAAFEKESTEADALLGRVWRVRLLAYERLARLAEAAEAIPAYVEADPDHAGPTLQALYSTLAADIETLRSRGDDAAATRKADVALILAEQVSAWSKAYQPEATAEEKRAMALQLAEAKLAAGHNAAARDLFVSCLQKPADDEDGADLQDRQVMYGLAESQYQLGEWDDALIRFNRLAVSLPVNDPIRWRSLLRDLQCRSAMNHAPRDIIKVIAQQRHMFPDLGGPRLAAEFDKLQRENQRRADGGKD